MAMVHGAKVIEEIQKIIAGTCFPSNPDMSGDPRKRLTPHEMRLVEFATDEIITYFENHTKGGADR
jgi:hypothetical protein